MAADFAQFTYELDWGNTEFIDFQITVAGVPQNITGWTVWFTAKRRAGDADPGIFQKTIANGGLVVTSAATGVGFIRIDPSDTASLPQERTTLWADQKAKDGAGQLFTVAKGTLIIRPEVTLSS